MSTQVNLQRSINGIAGVTIEGEGINQEFETSFANELEPEIYLIMFRLRGISPIGNTVTIPITRSSRKVCPKCKNKNKPFYDFCFKCGLSI
jgi:hypothetical protein